MTLQSLPTAQHAPSSPASPPETIRSMRPGHIRYCEHWAIVQDCTTRLRLNPDAPVSRSRTADTTATVERDKYGRYLVTCDFARHPHTDYANPPADWPRATHRGTGQR